MSQDLKNTHKEENVEYLHFIITGEYITDQVRNAFMEHRLSYASAIFEELRPVPDKLHQKMVLTGDAEFTGATICDDPKCKQCKGLKPFMWVNKIDKKYKLKLKEHEAYVKEVFVEVDGDIAVEKEAIQQVIEAEAAYATLRKIRSQSLESRANLTMKRALANLDDQREDAYDAFYRTFRLTRSIDYPIGSREWKLKLQVDSVLDIIKAKAKYSEEIQTMLDKAKQLGEKSGKAETMEGMARLFHEAFSERHNA